MIVLIQDNQEEVSLFIGSNEDFTIAEKTKLSEMSSGVTEIDFGDLAVTEKLFTITDANVISSSNVVATLAYEAPTGKDLDEIGLEKLQITCGQSIAGAFNMFINTINGSGVSGSFKINYLISS